MNTRVANILKARIANLAFIDRLAGLVKVMSGTVEVSESSTKRIYIPIACDVTEADCMAGRYQDLVPDASKRSVIYFEDMGGVQSLPDEQGMMRFRANLRLVVWLNLSRMGLTDCDYSAMAALAIIKAIKQTKKYNNEGDFVHFNVVAISEQEKSNAIFNKYSYEESITQYLLYPYDYFALNISVEFAVNPNCIENPEIPDIPLCDDNNGTVNPGTPTNGQCWDLLRWDCDKRMWVRWHPQTGEGDFSIHVDANGALSFVPVSNNIDCEQLAECQVIQDIQANIEQLNLDLGEEISLREQGDEALSNEIDAEVQAREDADDALQVAIDNEGLARVSGDDTNATNLNNHISNTNNPHNVTKAQVGLSNVSNDAQLKVSDLDTDGTLAANSDTKVPSQKAVKTYVDYFAGLYDRLKTWVLFTDFEGAGNSSATLNSDKLGLSFSGVGVTSSPLTTSESGHIGIMSIGTGVTIAGAVYIGTNAGIMAFGDGETTSEMLIKLPLLSTGTERYTARIGFVQSASGDPTNGPYFRYADNVNSGNWQLVSRSGGVETVVNLNSGPLADTWVKLSVVVNTAASLVSFYIDGLLVGTINTNIGATNIGCGFSIIKSVGTTPRLLYCDYIYAKKTFTTPR